MDSIYSIADKMCIAAVCNDQGDKGHSRNGQKRPYRSPQLLDNTKSIHSDFCKCSTFIEPTVSELGLFGNRACCGLCIGPIASYPVLS